MTLVIQVKNVYGNTLIYPACDKSRLFCQLMGTKTLTDLSVSVIKQLGYDFQVETPLYESLEKC